MTINPSSPLLQAILQQASQTAAQPVRPGPPPADLRPPVPVREAQETSPARKTVAPTAVSRETQAPHTVMQGADLSGRPRPRGSIINLLV